MAKVDWNTTDYSPDQRSFEPLPKGRYLTLLEDTEIKPTKSGNGSYLEAVFVVIAPKEFKGRKLWARLNVNNPSEIAQRIGREQFSALCIATVGTLEVKRTEALHGRKCVLSVSVEDNYNRVDAFEAAPPPSTGASAANPEPQPAPSDSKKRAPEGEDDDIPF